MGRAAIFVVALLAVEFLDEFVFGLREAAWPLLRDDLALSYVQVGLLLGVPGIVGSIVEPAIGILGDVWRRRALVLAGGAAFAVALLLVAASNSFLLLLAAFSLFGPASGAFVGLSQASLMDTAPQRHAQNMARWSLAGTLGVVLGSLALGAATVAGVGWRGLFAALAIAAAVMVVLAWRVWPGHAPRESARGPGNGSFRAGVAGALGALRRLGVLRGLALLELSDLMLDVLNGYIALYLVDVAGTSEAQAALGVAVWAGASLSGHFLMVPLLERVSGHAYLRASALAVLALFPGFLLAPTLGLKLALLAAVGLANAGWYSVLQGQLYSALPGQSGTVGAIGSVADLLGALMPLGLGAAAGLWGLDATMWLLLAAPIAILAGLARRG